MDIGLGQTGTKVKQVVNLQVELPGPLVDTACHGDLWHNYFAASALQIRLYAPKVAETRHAVCAHKSMTKDNAVFSRDICGERYVSDIKPLKQQQDLHGIVRL
jgi:hypothetical protein